MRSGAAAVALLSISKRRNIYAKESFGERIAAACVRARRLVACDGAESVLQANKPDRRRCEIQSRSRRQSRRQRVGAYVEPNIAVVDRQQRRRYVLFVQRGHGYDTFAGRLDSGRSADRWWVEQRGRGYVRRAEGSGKRFGDVHFLE